MKYIKLLIISILALNLTHYTNGKEPNAFNDYYDQKHPFFEVIDRCSKNKPMEVSQKREKVLSMVTEESNFIIVEILNDNNNYYALFALEIDGDSGKLYFIDKASDINQEIRSIEEELTTAHYLINSDSKIASQKSASEHNQCYFIHKRSLTNEEKIVFTGDFLLADYGLVEHSNFKEALNLFLVKSNQIAGVQDADSTHKFIKW